MISQGGMECFYWDWQLTAAGFGALVGLAGLIAFIVGSEAVRRGSPGAASYGPGVVTIACAFGCLALAVRILLGRHGQLNPCAYPGDPPRSDYLGWAQAGLTVAGALAVGGAYRLWTARRTRKEIAEHNPTDPPNRGKDAVVAGPVAGSVGFRPAAQLPTRRATRRRSARRGPTSPSG